jgi:hypothetical protein
VNPTALKFTHLISNSRDNPPTGQFRERRGDNFDTNHVLQDSASVPNFIQQPFVVLAQYQTPKFSLCHNTTLQRFHNGMSPSTSSAPYYPTSKTSLVSRKIIIYVDLSIASSRSPHGCTRPPYARGAQEWRDTQWTFGYMRYMDESYVEGGCANKSCESFKPLGANPLYGIDSDCRWWNV